MTKPLQGQAIIEKCREKVKAETGRNATYLSISEAIFAKTQIDVTARYLIDFRFYDRRPTDKYRAMFAQFLELELAEIAQHLPNELNSERLTRHRAAKDRHNEIIQLGRGFLSQSIVLTTGGE